MKHRRSTERSGRLLVLVFAAVIGSFLASSLFAQYVSAEIGGLSERIATNSAPSIENLASVRGSALEAELALSLYLASEATDAQRLEALEASLESLDAALHQYLRLTPSPGEQGVHDEVQQAWARFEDGARYTKLLADRGEIVQAQQRMWRIERAADALVHAAMQAIEFNAQYGQQLADRIGQTRRRAAVIASSLTALCVVLGLAGAVLLQRQTRARRVFADERARGLEERATELEQFAGRVAHDIRNPLSAALLASELITQTVEDEAVAEVGVRLKRNLARADAITTDLLQFARSGAKPDPGARTSPREIIADIAPQIELDAASQGIVVRWEPVPAARVACSEGVYLSLLGNLARNAIKYMGNATTRCITVTVVDEGASVRTEVADTGPGIPERSLPVLFEPYFRGDNARGCEGIGLGLPTVRKLAESHRGSVGVTSTPGGGSTFWFVLPRAGSAPSSDRVSTESGAEA
jgi:signal transduction histidine kinase